MNFSVHEVENLISEEHDGELQIHKIEKRNKNRTGEKN